MSNRQSRVRIISMDDTAQKQNANNGRASDDDQKLKITQTPVSSSLNKEMPSVSDFVKPSDTEPRVEAEVKNAGVEAVSEKPKLDEIHEKIGVKLSPEASSPNLNSDTNVSYQISEDEANEALKQNKRSLGFREMGEGLYVVPSVFGFATLFLKHLKKIHGKITGKKQV